MKNKKSKIIVPALALILLSTAASISGSVAWFTAARTTQVKTSSFTVVKTGDNLACAIEGVAGVTYDDVNKIINQKNNYNLTDASFDHSFHDASSEANYSDWVSPYVVTPDVPRTGVLKTTALGTGIASNALTLQSTSDMETSLGRGTGVYSAYVWNLSFSIKFTSSSMYNQGLFLDLADADTYMHGGAVEVAPEGSIAGLYTTPKCTGSAAGEGAKNTSEETKTYYKKPAATGKGFRIAIIPTAVPAGSMGYAKVWADNETNQTIATVSERRYVAGYEAIAANPQAVPPVEGRAASALTPTAYSTSTLSFNGTAFAAQTVNKTLLTRDDVETTVPVDNTKTNATALSDCANYLGYFQLPSSEILAGNNEAAKTITLRYTCVAWYEGTSPFVDSDDAIEPITSSMRFSVCNLNN